MPRKRIPFDKLPQSDLVVEATYEGGSYGNIKDDPLSKLMGCGNQGGFRPVGKLAVPGCKFVVLYSSLDDPDWPDRLDTENGLFVYFGDNKSPGSKLHETPKKGNIILRDTFALFHRSPPKRDKVPPFFDGWLQ